MNFIDRIIGDPNYLAFAAGATVTQKIDKVSTLLFLKQRLAGTLTNASYTTAPTKLVEAVENLVSMIALVAVGKGANGISDNIKAVDAAWAFRHTQFIEGTAPQRTDVGTTNAAFAFETNWKLYLGKLDARTLASLALQIGFRDSSAMVTGGVAGTATLSGVTVTTQAREIMGLAPANRPYLKESQQTFDITKSQLDTELKDLPVGNLIKRMCFKGMVGANNYSDPTDNIFATPNGVTDRAEGPHVRLEANGGYRPFDAIYAQARSHNKEQYKLESMPSGYIVWEPPTLWNARVVEKLKALVDLKFTASNTNTIQVTTVEIVQK
jgi:hypothetical protein